MDSFKFSYQTQLWGDINYAKTHSFQEWFEKESSNAGYYLSWDNIIKYYVAAGISGIELMMTHPPSINQLFGSPKNFLEFVKERGIEKITGSFSDAWGSEEKSNFKKVVAFNQKIIDFVYEMGGDTINLQPAGQYYGVGPLSQEQLKNSVACINEIGRRAADKGITVAIHNEFWCAINLYDHERFIEATDPRYVAYCLDTAQVSIMGVDPVKFYDKYHDRIKRLHLKDTNREKAPDSERFAAGAEFAGEGKRWFWEVGGGNIDFKGLWRMLKKYNRKGWVTIETDGTPDPLATLLLSKWYIDHELLPIFK